MKIITIILTLAVILAPMTCFAAEQTSGNAVVNGITTIVKLPITLLQKASDSMDIPPAPYTEDTDMARPVMELAS